MHVRDVGIATGGADDPRRGSPRAPRAQAQGRPLAAASIATSWRRLLRRGLLPARDADRAPDGRAAHAVRRVRAGQRRRRAGEPEGVRGDRARVRALPPRVPAGRAGRGLRRSSGSSTGCGPATRPRGSAICARRSRATSAGGSSATRRRARSSPSSRTSRSASTSRRACSRRSARRSTPRTAHAGGSGPARARGALPVGGALVAGRPASGRRRRRRRGGRRAAEREQACARSDHGVVHGPVAAGTGAGARNAPGRRVPGGARRARRRGAGRAAGAVRAGRAGASTTAARATGRSSTSGCTTSCTCSARST